jgi:hypothetical protein
MACKHYGGDAVAMVMEVIDAHIECWFLQVLQLDVRTLRLEALEINDEQRPCR